ncbi:FAD dependent oxidoreductase [Thalassoporum mexicanum PCC 7367]|uniref:FAD-dependent oxidoreductase n=1 Tax=Thalassoporum mexicanum TaxID=3457544 RepID=UPI00029FD328|nr:FAD-dependent oxidoreductase [Pseudanabaena sp. PCC 7367]AFY70543.1 FAD dependent oxidoreductase [Pseudanabaena sp. PCC 7367]
MSDSTTIANFLAKVPEQNALESLKRADAFWQAYRTGNISTPEVVQKSNEAIGELDVDVLVCGGTLGIFMGTALAKLGWRVALLEKGKLQGRAQEWNISRQELQTFVDLELLTPEQLDQAIATTYNPGRVGFNGGKELWVRDVLNIGVDPVFLLETLKQQFLAHGGKLLEYAAFQTATVHSDGVKVSYQLNQPDQPDSQSKIATISGRLLLDVMGHFSPIARQARSQTTGNIRPDGVCMVVGTCAQGIPTKDYGDLIYTFTPIINQCQYFWEAFPARDGRTTYMFTYVDAHPDRPSFSDLFADYLHWLPKYQDVELDQIQPQRSLYGFFPAYKQAPLPIAWPRILQVGDSSGSQSPLSFGGFGAMVRHLSRLTQGIDRALASNSLAESDLQLLQPYQPNISVTWLFQKTMSVGVNENIEGDRINYLLSTVFECMEKLGEPVLKPFLQDVVQFSGLTQAMLSMYFKDPILVAKIVGQVGIGELLSWSKHFLGLGGYSLLNSLLPYKPQASDRAANLIKSLSPQQQFKWQQRIAAWHYGSGGDFEPATG